VKGENIASIELAAGAAAVVLAVRLYSLIRATRGVPDAHRQVVEALSTGDPKKLKQKASGLGYLNPYGEGAAYLIEASQREGLSGEQRVEGLERATATAKRRISRRTEQGQAMDFVALCVAIGIVIFAGDVLPTGPLFRSLASAIIVLLLSSLGVRAKLQASVTGSLEVLRSVLVARPQLPSLSDGPIDCFWCGERTERRSYDIQDVSGGGRERVLAAVCGACGKFVATLAPDDPDSSADPRSS
jgi:hypothetical protein